LSESGFCVGGPRAKIVSAEDAGEALDRGLREGGRVGAMEEGVELGHGSYDFVGEAREAVTLVIWDVFVVVGKAKVGCDVTCGLGLNMETREGELVKVGVQGL